MNELDCDKSHPEATSRESEETQAMREVIAKTELTDIERELVEAHLRGDKGHRTLLSRTRINPDTGRLYTRQWLGVIFKKACEKLQEAYCGEDGIKVA